MGIGIVLITCVINLALGLFVLLRAPKAGFSRAFLVMTLLISAWILTSYVTDQQNVSLYVNDLANRLAFVSGYGVVLSGLIFTYNFPVARRIRRLERVLLLVTSVYMFFVSSTPLVAGTVTLRDGSLVFEVGPLIWLYVVGYIGIIVLIARNLLSLPRRLGRNEKAQARLVLAAFIASAAFGLVSSVVAPILSSDWQTTQFGPLATLLLAIVIVYAVVRHGLFDVRLAVVRTVAYILSLLTLATLYFVIALTLSTAFLNDSVLIQPLGVVLALVLAFIFQPIKRFFDKLTNQLFYKDNYSIDDFFARLTRLLSSTTDLRDLLMRASIEIGKTLKSEQAFFFVYLDDGHYLTAGTSRHVKLPFRDAELLKELVSEDDGIILTSEEKKMSDLYRLLVSHRLGLLMPLYHNDLLVGYLGLGDHLNSGYTSRDVKALNTISDGLVIAIQNAMSVHAVKSLNDTLQQRVDSATKELRASNAQLQRLDEAKDEFISMASHQLRTPLTSVKGYISMVVEGDAGKVNDTQKHFLEEAFLSSERMVRLINDFLNVSRLQTGKFLIERHDVDLVKVVKQEMETLGPNAASRKLKFTFKAPKKFPILSIDEGKIRQVIMNFSDNAIYYSKEDSVINLELKVDKKDVTFLVKDKGIGVPLHEQENLFNKFFRATNARKQRPDGTGVGLFLAKKVIDAHKGTLVFESKEGKGSTFGFKLPLANLSAGKDPNQLEK